MSWIKNKIICLIAYILPSPLDLDWFGVFGVNSLPVVGQLPVRKIDFGALSWPKRILTIILMLVPYFDLELFTFFGLDHKLGLYSQGTSTSASNSNPMSTRRGQQPQQGGHSLGGIFKLLAILLVIGAVFTTGYGSLASNTVGNQVIGLDLEDELLAAQQAAKQAQCFGNAACMRKWRFNNTQQPGSEEVGQEYKLDIEEFSVNSGDVVDVSGRRPGYVFPVTFSVYNPRNGLKGIEARDAQYRVQVQKAEGFAGIEGAQTLCSTDWQPLNGQYATSYGGESGTIYPGGFATPIGTLSDLNLSSCGLMQPALGLNRHVELDVKYNYSSQAQISFEAMASDNIEGRPGFKKSQTADTPVKTFINVQDPATYVQDGNDIRPNVFLVRVGFETAQNSIRYKIAPDELEIHDSSATVDVKNAPQRYQDMLGDANCMGLTRTGEDTYKLSERQREFIRGEWYETGEGPSEAICAMILEDPESISPTGETLRMSVDANYTVELSESVTNFQAQNNACGADQRMNCPYLVPEDKKDDYEDVNSTHLISTCDSDVRTDAADGCSVRKGSAAGDKSWITVELWNLQEVDGEIDEGETAYTWGSVKEDYSQVFTDVGDVENTDLGNAPGRMGLPEEQRDTAIGLTDEERSTLDAAAEGNSEGAALVKHESFGNNDVEVRSVEPVLCKQGFGSNYSATMKDFAEYWAMGNPDAANIMLFEGASVNDCSKQQNFVEELADWYVDNHPLLGQWNSPKEKFQEEVDTCTDGSDNLTGVIVLDGDGFECFDG